MKKISVIVPVYNVEKYLEKCLKSIISQTLKEIEIIIVNDGSLDNSEEIILKYLAIDNRIKYYKKENGGLSDARNYGLKYSKGEYISFIDSDDYIDNTMLEKMYEKSKEDQSDIVICGFKSVYESGVVRTIKNYKEKVTFKDILEISFAWNKIYKKYLFENIEFPIGKHYEDMFCIPQIAMKANKISFISQELYNYVIRKNSITTKRDNYKIYDLLEACLFNKKLINLSNDEKLKKDWLEYSKIIKNTFYSFINNYSIIFKIKNRNRTIEYFKELEIFDWRDYLKYYLLIFYPKYYLKKIYINIKKRIRNEKNFIF